MAMHLLGRVENALMALSDGIFARWPRSCPDSGRLKHCRIVAHRGEHDNRLTFENTLAAFDAAVAAGVWGIEFDIRWTQDREPVVIHDPGLQRVFGVPLTVAGATRAELRQRFKRSEPGHDRGHRAKMTSLSAIRAFSTRSKRCMVMVDPIRIVHGSPCPLRRVVPVRGSRVDPIPRTCL